MNSREKIIAAVLKNQPPGHALPDLSIAPTIYASLTEQFKSTVVRIGGAVMEVNTWQEIAAYLEENHQGRIVNTIHDLHPFISEENLPGEPHLLENVQVAVMKGHFGIAENGAVWVTDEMMGDRVLPFITENLALVIRRNDIAPTLHEAYSRISSSQYHFGTFIAGPSKTADIEQSLVIGAHGPKSMIVFLLKE
jgi:L-lactate dehydrogenase complex protein LldG